MPQWTDPAPNSYERQIALFFFFSLPLEWPQTCYVSIFNKESHVSTNPQSWLGLYASWTSHQWETACFLCIQLFSVLPPPIPYTETRPCRSHWYFKTLPLYHLKYTKESLFLAFTLYKPLAPQGSSGNMVFSRCLFLSLGSFRNSFTSIYTPTYFKIIYISFFLW